MGRIDYQQMLEDHGYRAEYESGVAKVWAFGCRYGLGSFDPSTKNRQFNLLAVEIASQGESFSGWSEDVVLEIEGKCVRWSKVFGKERSDDG